MRFAVALLVALYVAVPARAHADDALALAKVAIAESGWRAPRDRHAIWWVLRRRAERLGWTLKRMAWAYSSPLKRGHWAGRLTPSGDRPRGWPSRLNWEAHRGEWEAILEEARAFVAGQIADPCAPLRPYHFGDREGDYARAIAAGWHEVDCGTANAMWTER